MKSSARCVVCRRRRYTFSPVQFPRGKCCTACFTQMYKRSALFRALIRARSGN
jgi:hypothetical protein